MLFRKVIFWIHLLAGLVAGVVIAIMSATGIAIAFEEEILAWIDRDARRIAAVAPGAQPRSLTDLRASVEQATPGFVVTHISRPRDPQAAWEFHAESEGHVYVDPYTGEVRASRAHAAHEMIHTLEEWHRWLGAKDGLASTGRLVTGVCNLAFVVLCVTGLYLWFPRSWSRCSLRPLLWFVGRFRGKARDFNWHNVFGFWSMPVLLVLASTGVVISFEWGHRLVFALAGEAAPKARNYGMMAVPPPDVPAPAPGATRITHDEAFARVAAAFPEWKAIGFDLPTDAELAAEEPAPLDFGVTVPDSMPSRAFIPVKTDPFTGDVLQAVRFQDRSPGLQARVWIRFLHTGGAFGLPGKIVATLATATSLVLVWTGLALSWRRFLPKRKKAVPTPVS
jgi:uncharacterized iron-regulated membrane protein